VGGLRGAGSAGGELIFRLSTGADIPLDAPADSDLDAIALSTPLGDGLRGEVLTLMIGSSGY
jgi:hypothetical protein